MKYTLIKKTKIAPDGSVTEEIHGIPKIKICKTCHGALSRNGSAYCQECANKYFQSLIKKEII